VQQEPWRSQGSSPLRAPTGRLIWFAGVPDLLRDYSLKKLELEAPAERLNEEVLEVRSGRQRKQHDALR